MKLAFNNFLLGSIEMLLHQRRAADPYLTNGARLFQFLELLEVAILIESLIRPFRVVNEQIRHFEAFADFDQHFD